MLNKFSLEKWVTEIALPGTKFGRLTVLCTGKKPSTYKYYAVCQCECGSNPKPIRIDGLRKGTVTSCGCFHREQTTKHGLWDHPLYRVWHHMHQRCYDKKSQRYKNYGEKGIEVCARWHDVAAFVEDMSDSFRPGLQIDRIDNSKGYSKDNCKWSTQDEQQLNTTRSRKFTFDGKTLCLSQWSRLLGITYGTLWDRIEVQKWPVERAFTTRPLDADERLKIARAARVKI